MKASTLLLTLLIMWPTGHALAGDAPVSDALAGDTVANETLSEKVLPEAAINDAPSKKQQPVSSDQNTEAASHTQSDRKPVIKEGETIWLEKKIAPTTRWVEKLVQPLSTWMEKKIQPPEPTDSNLPQKHPSSTKVVDTAPVSTSSDSSIMTPQDVSSHVRRLISGEVLKVKLLPSDQMPLRYRVKLISRVGEMHIVYIDAHNGMLLTPTNQPTNDLIKEP